MGHYEKEGDFDAENEEIHSAFSTRATNGQALSPRFGVGAKSIGQAKAFRANSQAFVNLSIYEQRIQRGIHNPMKQLREVQAERKEPAKRKCPMPSAYRETAAYENLDSLSGDMRPETSARNCDPRNGFGRKCHPSLSTSVPPVNPDISRTLMSGRSHVI
jgi:hypothetical protein